MILDAYKSFYYNTPTGDIPQFGKAKKDADVSSFEDAVRSTYMKLSPVVSGAEVGAAMAPTVRPAQATRPSH